MATLGNIEKVILKQNEKEGTSKYSNNHVSIIAFLRTKITFLLQFF